MSNNRLTRIAVAVAAVGAVGGGAAATAIAATGHSASAGTVKVGSVTVGGAKHSLLVTSTGKPVYLLTGDSMKHALCTSKSCLSFWPPVTTSGTKAVAGAGVKGKLTVWTHKGMHQLVLNGHPLYTFASDSGSTAKGQGIKNFGGTWWLMTGSGASFTSTASSGTTSTGGGSSSGSGSSSGGSTSTSGSPATSWS